MTGAVLRRKCRGSEDDEAGPATPGGSDGRRITDLRGLQSDSEHLGLT
jgi:hypothetical protein